jgi:predicted outer membrane repeat protein
VTDNTAADVGGALRTLGTLDVTGSTFTGNRSAGWHGGALFVTDGVATVRSSTFDGNPGPGWANTSLFVGTFGDASASLVLGGPRSRNAGGEVCFLAPFGSRCRVDRVRGWQHLRRRAPATRATTTPSTVAAPARPPRPGRPVRPGRGSTCDRSRKRSR